ncbi:bifunctional metallophosphatase/5'-nucleotidase [Derxia gummosa]|uniref:Bifunctional metallophosphatase/5'-nucleotidase n=1 Tax=Derxia gummosa DSM 723 TaxID=1121388 RepID=A0A8B6X7L0_9BURK|nr:bifunctional metallophosphatase/5'-nucleotidase [Derxia gummosa]
MKTPHLLALALAAGVLTGGGPALAATAPSPASASVAAASGATAKTSPNAPIPLRLVAVNDFHGNLEAGRLTLTVREPQARDKPLKLNAGGAPALAGMVTQLRVGAPHTIFFSAGDLVGAAPLVSTLYRHEPTVEVMNKLGLDFNVLGNHEFDAGRVELQRLMRGGCGGNEPHSASESCALHHYEGSKFAWLSANVKRADGATLVPADVVRTVGGVKVGFIGATTRDTPGMVMRSGIAGLSFDDEADAINARVAALRRRGVEAIVAVLHEGGELARDNDLPGDWNDPGCPGASGRIFELAKRIAPQVDAIFSAHTHQGYACVMDGRPIVQATSYGRGLAVVDLAIDPRSRDVIRERTRAVNLPVVNGQTDMDARRRLAAALPPELGHVLVSARDDKNVAALVERYARLAAPRANRELGKLDGAFTRAGADKGDSTAGRLIADAQLAATREHAGAQLAFMNSGGVRADLDCGRPGCGLTFGQAFVAQPFGNTLVTLTLTGAELKELLESQQRPGDALPRFLQPSSNLSYTWRQQAPHGEHVDELRLDGKPIAADAKLRITVNNYLAEGGDGHALLREGRDRVTGPGDLDALAAFLRAKSPLKPDDKTRIRYVP